MNDVTVVTSVTYPSPESLALVADVQYHEPYLSAALNRKFRGIVDPGFYAGFLPKPGGGMNLLITSVDGDKTAGAASVDIGEFYQVTIQHRKDISLALNAGKKYAIVLKGRYLLGEDTYQVNTASHIHAAEFVARTYTDSYQLGDGELLVCTVNIPAGVSTITQEMIDTSERINRTIGIDISDSVTSTRSDVAASSLAVKKAYDLAKSKYTAQDASTTQKGLVQLSSETNSDSETMAATPKAVKSVKDLADTKAPIESPSLTGTPTAPTAAQGTNSTQIANTAFVKAAITALINGAPGTLDTLKEIAAAINNDPNFSTTINNALALKAPLASPALTGIPTAPTAAQGTNNTQIATTAYVRAAISALVGSSPEALDTLNELAAALGNDPNFSATVTRLIGEKVAKDGDTMTGKLNLPQTSAFGINTNNRLGGNSLTLGDYDTGIKQEGDGVLSVFANGQRVFLFTERSITSLKELLIGDARYSTGGDVYGSQWGDGWLSSWLSARFAECANASHNHPWSQITDVPAASLTQSGIVQLSSAINSSSETLAATPKAVKAAYDLANGKYTAQDATTAQKGIVQLSSATNSASETLAATPKAVKAAYDLANGKYTAQDATTARKGLVQLSSDTNSMSETLAATPKAVKAVMDETNKKAPLNSPALTGTPTTPTAPQGTNNTQIASTAFVMAAIAALVDSSPDALNTLNELAAALGNDPNFATTMTNALAGKQPKDATLTALAELATSADKLPYFTGADRAALTALTSVGRAILGKTSIQSVLDYLGLGEGSALPVGVPVPWPLETPPTGWLKCNGAAFSSEKYPNMAKAYPANKLPDLRGEFIRGWDDGRGIDPSRQLLGWQKGTLVGGRDDNDVSVDISYMSNANSIDYGGDKTFSNDYRSDYLWYAPLGKVTGRAKAALSGVFFNVTRPRNIAFNYIVRAA